jgi:ABC-type sulfate/molybdate transport systems ATPase subunit
VVMGPSGAGKSTLLRAIAGLVDHDGSVAVGGRDLAGVAPHRRGVGLLFQNPRMFPTMTALDNVAYPLRLRGMPRGDRRAYARTLLDEVGVGDRAGAAPHELSGGEQQRVALARALCSAPEVLLLDEPLTGLDLPQRRDLVRLLAAIRRDRDLTWLVVTHDPDDAAVLADTVAVLVDGRLVQHDTIDAVYTRPADEVVCALTANPNMLRGRVEDGMVCFGGVEVAVGGHDGMAAFTIPPQKVRMGRGGAELARLPMTVVDIERRGGGQVLRLHSEVATLEVPCDGSTRPGSVIDVYFDPADLWRIPAGPAPQTVPPSKESD